MSNQSIKTPCVGLCSTVYGDLVCRGCKRFHHEVIHWNGYDDEQKRAVWLRLEQLLVQVMMAKLEVFDKALLRQQLEQRSVRFVAHQSEYCWAYQLIARGARMIRDLEAYGMALLPEFLTTGFRLAPIPFVGPWLDSVAPSWFTQGMGLQFFFGGTSLLIVVGVAMDTVQQVESQLIMRHYDGFMKKTRIRGRRGQ